MYGDLATKLILEAKRTKNLTELPIYEHELVKNILQETSDLHKDVEFLNEQQLTQTSMENDARRINQCQLFVTHLCLRRNKRCMLAYEKLRAGKIDEFSWLNIDPVLSGSKTSTSLGNLAADSIRSKACTKNLAIENLSHQEQEYFKKYQDILLDFKSSFADIDLSGDLEPPKEIFIDVRVLKNGGEVQTEYGVFNLIKDSQFYVRKSDVDRLIQQGFLEEI
ncbi:GINS complex, Psf1 component [Metschnikowia bicuspidata var. bicuspidata NRRL YB-4993]|uniref:DNA replication complex GINS protein PSF1 n=1 Tax=Metschnikowia bicuspidata var. bicuspidata NRRL YB-4993 TaxID=869754 RepID=A0A1A0HB24_9ASCO|nr:GINS complex, Psf1 component [Metschnikowia bicuspidata var. bicuspidata NRRL YB-4993]OBA21190.1 GINS complex, Psf1 component [Metschnikowia bicuspidata var. bicuspidata NRRL YB-4993]